ncbi:DUF6973 domain-containing protein [Paucihalobacter sp.]|uniref:DUF6973 domain-containing protein n=1 Tax=Paucihalobacter sp. TaxID=2850405 RepID=UPI002FDF87F9
MAVWNRIKSLSFKQLFLLVKTFALKPQYFFPTHQATLQTLQICNRLYGKKHHKNNITNAFRHALWNILIAFHCYKKNKSIETSVNWAKKTTDLHEKLAPNNQIEMLMDLQNNNIGRIIFTEHNLFEHNKEAIISILKEKMKTAVLITTISEIENFKNEFVYLEEL